MSSYAWGGSQPVAMTTAYLATPYGAFISSTKRASNHPLSISNPSSDHNMANLTAYAIDFATFSGVPLAYALAKKLGLGNYRTGNYNFYYIRRGGATFRVQNLWAVSGHFNHVHLGVRLASGTYNPGPQYYVHKPALPKALTRKEEFLAGKLLYHRSQRAKEARSGKGPKWENHDNWCKYWYHEIQKRVKKIPGNQFKRPARRAALLRILNHKYDWERRKK